METLWAKADDAPPKIIIENGHIEFCYDTSSFDRVKSAEHTNDEIVLSNEDLEWFYEQERKWEDELAGFYAMQSDKYDNDIDYLMSLEN